MVVLAEGVVGELPVARPCQVDVETLRDHVGDSLAGQDASQVVTEDLMDVDADVGVETDVDEAVGLVYWKGPAAPVRPSRDR